MPERRASFTVGTNQVLFIGLTIGDLEDEGFLVSIHCEEPASGLFKRRSMAG